MRKIKDLSEIILIIVLVSFFFIMCQPAAEKNEAIMSLHENGVKALSPDEPDPVIVDSTGIAGEYNSIAVDGSKIYISYYNRTNGNLKFARSTDKGATWLAANIKTIDSLGDVGEYSSIAVSGFNVYISYYDRTNGSLKFARSTDGGVTWPAANIRTVDDMGDIGVSYASCTGIAADGLNVYIAYFYGICDVLKFARTTDGGETWPAANIKTADNINHVGLNPSIKADGLNIYISYCDWYYSNLKFTRSTDGGATWPAGNIKTIDTAGDIGRNNSIAVDGLNVYISYHDATNENLKFAKSADRGESWPAANIRTVESAGDVGRFNSIACYGSNVYISYFAYGAPVGGNLKFAKSSDRGATWPAANMKLLDYGDMRSVTSITADGPNIFISYNDYLNGDLKFVRSKDFGITW